MMSHEEVHDGVRQHTGIYPYSRRISPPPPSSVPTTRPVPGPSAPSSAPAAKLFAASCNSEAWTAAGVAEGARRAFCPGIAIDVLCLRGCTGAGAVLEVKCGAEFMTFCEPSNAIFMANRGRRVHNYYSRLAVGNLRIDDRQEPSQ